MKMQDANCMSRDELIATIQDLEQQVAAGQMALADTEERLAISQHRLQVRFSADLKMRMVSCRQAFGCHVILWPAVHWQKPCHALQISRWFLGLLYTCVGLPVGRLFLSFQAGDCLPLSLHNCQRFRIDLSHRSITAHGTA